ncbi:MAG: NCS2 family permease, partial [Oscillospiraceae bacterium]
GIGLFIAFIGLINAGIVTVGNGFTDLGNITAGGPLLAIIGLIIMAILMAWNVKGAIFIGIVVTTIIGFPLGVSALPETFTIAPTLHTLFKFD